MPGRDNKTLIAAAVLLLGGAAALAWPRAADAQLPIEGAEAVITVPGSVTSDQAAETSLADIDTVQLPGILQQDTSTATSVTTGGGAGFYTPNYTLIGNLDQQLFSQVNSQNAAELFPGFQALAANTIADVQGISTATLTTYANALADAQAQGAELTNENFSNIEAASANTTDLLAAVQANTEVGLQVASELQYIRQQLNTLIEVEATKASEEMNERSQEAATSAVHFNGGSMP